MGCSVGLLEALGLCTSPFLFPGVLDPVDDQDEDDEEDVGGNAAHGFDGLALESLRVVHHHGEVIVAVDEDQRAGGDQLGDGDQNTGQQDAENGVHGRQLVVADGDQDEYRPNDDGVEAEIDQLDVVGRADDDGDGGEDARRGPEFTRTDGLIGHGEEADGATGCLGNVAEHDVGQEEEEVVHERGIHATNANLSECKTHAAALSLGHTALTVQ